MDLSIVIVNWNGLAVLRNCLGSIFASPQGIRFEVIVVDNASHDDSTATIEREFPQVVILRNQQNLGFAAANNQAFALARGRCVLLLNNDTLVLPGALAESVRYLDGHPQVGALGCRVEYPDGSFQSSYYRVHDLWDLLTTRLLPFDLVPKNRLNRSRYWGKIFSQPQEVEVVAGCFFLVRRQVIDEVGLLDEDFFMYGEEEEWCFRIRQNGWKIIYHPGVRIIHLHGFSARKARKAMNLITRKSPLLVLEKTQGVWAAWTGNIFMMTGALIRLPLWLLGDMVKGKQMDSISTLVRGRMTVLRFHLAGLFRPVWRQRLPGEGLRRSPQ